MLFPGHGSGDFFTTTTKKQMDGLKKGPSDIGQLRGSSHRIQCKLYADLLVQFSSQATRRSILELRSGGAGVGATFYVALAHH